MQQQENAGRARMIGYAIGLAAFAAVILWKLVIR
jgi:hypothetical protein